MLEHSSDNENQPLLRSEYSLNQANYENRSQNELVITNVESNAGVNIDFKI